jgi:hypothetical protein
MRLGWPWVRRGAIGTVLLMLLLVGHYTLPQVDVVRVVGTENRRIEFGWNSFFWASPDAGTATTGAARDVFFIQGVDAEGAAVVFRNEDTGWGWPPYFKFSSHDMQAIASSLVSGPEAPQWVAVTHYGWRSELLTIFPNALRLSPVEGPEARVIPWGSLAILGALAVGLLALWRVLILLRRAYIDPLWGRVARFIGREG